MTAAPIAAHIPVGATNTHIPIKLSCKIPRLILIILAASVGVYFLAEGSYIDVVVCSIGGIGDGGVCNNSVGG